MLSNRSSVKLVCLEIHASTASTEDAITACTHATHATRLENFNLTEQNALTFIAPELRWLLTSMRPGSEPRLFIPCVLRHAPATRQLSALKKRCVQGQSLIFPHQTFRKLSRFTKNCNREAVVAIRSAHLFV